MGKERVLHTEGLIIIRADVNFNAQNLIGMSILGMGKMHSIRLSIGLIIENRK